MKMKKMMIKMIRTKMMMRMKKMNKMTMKNRIRTEMTTMISKKMLMRNYKNYWKSLKIRKKLKYKLILNNPNRMKVISLRILRFLRFQL